MTGPLATSLTPEEQHLTEQERLLAALAEELAIREFEFATEGVEFARFRHHYLRRFAPLYAEMDRLEAEVAAGIAEREPTPELHPPACLCRLWPHQRVPNPIFPLGTLSRGRLHSRKLGRRSRNLRCWGCT